ncbi:MAG TPA: N-6 DNA methylase, partial [Methylomirabilota bacterium]|nr:N-6 DNA methylase [Methylomirabilota bacterium]
MQHFVGYDISPDMVKLSLVNMYLHSFPNPNVFEYDTLTSEERWDDTYDVIMANPPFMSPKGGIRPHKRFSIQANRSEVLFVDYIAEHLNIYGRAGVIVPEGIIFQSGIAYKALRKMLVEKYLFAVVSLPGGIFQPYSGVKTSILLMDKQLAKKADSILFVKVENDGFDLGAQRRAIEKNDLTKALYILQKYKEALQINTDVQDVFLDEEEATLATVVEKAKIAKNGDYNLSGERYREVAVHINIKWPMVELGEVCEINPKKSEIKTVSPEMEVSFVPMSDLSDRGMFFEVMQTKKLSEVLGGYTYFCDNDVLLAKVTPCFENGKSGIARGLKNKIGFGSSEFIVLRSSERIIPELVYRFVSSERFREIGKSQMTGTGGLQRLPMGFISEFQIPLPPIEVQQEIVAELESYQKIIDGARQVLEYYKIQIPISSKWNEVNLGDISEIIMGQSPLGETYNQRGEGIPLINGPVEFGPTPFSKTIKSKFTTQPTKLCKVNDLILCVRGSTTGRMNIAGFDACIGRGVAAIRSEKYQKYINFYISSIQKEIYDLGSGSTFPNVTAQDIHNIKVPLPPKEDHQKIVERLEEEQKLVVGNKKLIEIFEQKIKDKIA